MTIILHAVDVRPEPDERRKRAMASWKGVWLLESDWQERSAIAIGDSRDLPYWKDLMEVAKLNRGPHEIVIWTNDDSVLHPQCLDAVRRHVGIWGVGLSHRREFKTSIPCLTDTPQQWVEKSEFHIGYDVFEACVEWGKK